MPQRTLGIPVDVRLVEIVAIKFLFSPWAWVSIGDMAKSGWNAMVGYRAAVEQRKMTEKDLCFYSLMLLDSHLNHQIYFACLFTWRN